MWKKILYSNFPSLARFYRKQEYELLSKLIRQKKIDVTFINYGYAGKKYSNGGLKLTETEEKSRYAVQLYDHIVSNIDIKGLNVLEVGSGRGGGANFIVNKYKPKLYVGVDIANNAVNFCKKTYANGKLIFFQGNAESLQFDDDSFDVILNLESSHCYPKIGSFFSEARRILKPKGLFLIADWRFRDDVKLFKNGILEAGLKLKKEEDISRNVLEALGFDDSRKRQLVNKLPGIARGPFSEFAGLKGYGLYGGLKQKKISYMNYVFANV